MIRNNIFLRIISSIAIGLVSAFVVLFFSPCSVGSYNRIDLWKLCGSKIFSPWAILLGAPTIAYDAVVMIWGRFDIYGSFLVSFKPFLLVWIIVSIISFLILKPIKSTTP
jgi:hypothetical protein